MLRDGDSIRLTPVDAERLELATGFAPVGIKTVGELVEYIERCKRHWEGYPSTARLHRLIDGEFERCITATEVPSRPAAMHPQAERPNLPLLAQVKTFLHRFSFGS